jgi:DNA-binding transcriptional LysR family regulator
MKPIKQSLPLLNALAVFESAARHCNFTKASEELHISQPAVSRHITNLERQIGQPLFRRHAKKLFITDSGQRLAAAVASGFGHVADVVEELERQARGRPFTIACGYDFAYLWLMPRFSELRAALPDRPVRLVTAHSYLDFDTPDIDVSIRRGDGHWAGMEAVKLFDNAAYPVCAPSLLKKYPALRRARNAADVLAAPLLHFETDGKSSWLPWFDAFALAAPKTTAAETFTSSIFLLQAALEGRGVALAWKHIWDEYIQAGRLVRLTRHTVASHDGMYFVHPRAVDDPVRDRIIEWLSDSVSRHYRPI